MWSLPSLNTLLSVPLLSVFLLPSSATSYTTSLNLFFFYLTWSTILFTYSPLVVELYTLLASRLIFYLLPSALFLAFDLAIPGLSSSLKTNGSLATPSRATGISSSSAKWKIARIPLWSLFNTLLAATLHVLLDLLCTEILHIRGTLRISKSLPMPWTLAKDLTLSYPIRGISSYYIHRYILHSPQRAPRLARWHATWAHSLRHPIPFSAAYDHPACFLLHRWIPVVLPLLLTRIHILSYTVCLALVSAEEALAYSGYAQLPSTILLAGIARRQEAHVLSGGDGNYAPFGVLDWVHGTGVSGTSDAVEDMGAEARKRDVRGKAGRAVQRAEDWVEGEEEEEEDAGSGEREAARGNGSVMARMRRGKKK